MEILFLKQKTVCKCNSQPTNSRPTSVWRHSWPIFLNSWRFHPQILQMTTQPSRWRQITIPSRPLAPNNLRWLEARRAWWVMRGKQRELGLEEIFVIY